VLASRYAGIAPPIDGVTQEFNDPQVVEDDAAHGRAMGFGGKLLIHPKQIEPARRAFLPSPDEIAWAKRILEAAGSNTGVLTVDGRMVDAPVLKRARQILARTDLG
jgi:citrate lyase subunit beta/citryl-CoA lyase